MRDLQEYFESKPLSELLLMSKAFEKPTLTKSEQEWLIKICKCIISIWESEMDCPVPSGDDTFYEKMTDDFNLKLNIYINIKRGFMSQRGRLMLSNDECRLNITDLGVKNVENVIAKR